MEELKYYLQKQFCFLVNFSEKAVEICRGKMLSGIVEETLTYCGRTVAETKEDFKRMVDSYLRRYRRLKIRCQVSEILKYTLPKVICR